MDPNPKNFPILSYVMARFPSMKRPNNLPESDIEQQQRSPSSPRPGFDPEPYFELTERMPHLTDPEVLAAMRSAVADVSQTRSLLKTLGERPDHESVDMAKARIAEIDAMRSNELDEIALSETADPEAEKQKKAMVRERQMHKALISLDQMHESYDKMLSDAEKRLEKLYEAAKAGRKSVSNDGSSGGQGSDEFKEEVVAILSDALSNGAERIDLSERRLPFLPEAFGKLHSLVYLNLASNQLEAIPDSVAGLESLEELNVSSNTLGSLPDSIGCLLKLKILDVSSNKLSCLPDSICQCRSLVELDAGFNKLTYLPTKIGNELVNLKKLIIPLNKVRNLPTSIGEMKSLQLLDAHFNELRGLPKSIGKLSNLEVLNLGSNFSDLTELPHTIGDLTNLKELDVSNNQLTELPMTFGRLDKLRKLNVDQNPLVIPPKEVVAEGIGAVKVYMAQRWFDLLVEEEEKSRRETEAMAKASWLTRSTSWLAGAVFGAAGTASLYLGAGETEDPYLEEER